MTQDNIWNLIAKKLSGEADREELQELEDQLRINPDLHYSMQNIIDLWKPQRGLDLEEAHQAFNRHLERMQEQCPAFTPGNFYSEEEERFSTQPPKKRYRSRILWSAVSLSVIAGVLFIGLGIFRNSGKLTTQTAANNPAAAEKTTSEISTKNGSKTNVVLPDGTMVWLNAGSKLTYDKSYNNILREVTLVGEAFFDVVHNAEKPFVIHTSKINIKVLGTKFNVKSYPADKTTEASLIRGSIEVSFKDRPTEKIILKPNEKIVVSNDEYATAALEIKRDTKHNSDAIVAVRNLTHYKNIGPIVETSWVENKLVFQDESFEDLAPQLERWYGIAIAFENPKMKDLYFTGSFTNENVTQALDALKISNNFNYTIADGKNITILK
jgi:ferric-dicitrate binding protein FerR (iron transport regulator)